MSNQLINRPPKLVTIVTQSIRKSIVEAVSYTHLTLPTSDLV